MKAGHVSADAWLTPGSKQGNRNEIECEYLAAQIRAFSFFLVSNDQNEKNFC